MRISSVYKARRNKHFYTMLIGINVNWNCLSRKYKYVTEVLKLFILCDPVILFLETLMFQNAAEYVHCNVIYNSKKKKKSWKTPRRSLIMEWLQ